MAIPGRGRQGDRQRVSRPQACRRTGERRVCCRARNGGAPPGEETCRTGCQATAPRPDQARRGRAGRGLERLEGARGDDRNLRRQCRRLVRQGRRPCASTPCPAIGSCEKTGERGPDYRVFAGQTEFGAAWKKTSRNLNGNRRTRRRLQLRRAGQRRSDGDRRGPPPCLIAQHRQGRLTTRGAHEGRPAGRAVKTGSRNAGKPEERRSAKAGLHKVGTVRGRTPRTDKHRDRASPWQRAGQRAP